MGRTVGSSSQKGTVEHSSSVVGRSHPDLLLWTAVMGALGLIFSTHVEGSLAITSSRLR